MSYYQHGSEGQIVMICQVCNTRCHADGPKKGYFLNKEETEKQGRPVYFHATCPLCVCHDCVQLADDPVRAGLAPAILNQTMSNPFNLGQAIDGLANKLGLVPEPEKRHALPRSAACMCGEPARSRCISCDEALCGRCVKGHHCRSEEGGSP